MKHAHHIGRHVLYFQNINHTAHLALDYMPCLLPNSVFHKEMKYLGIQRYILYLRCLCHYYSYIYLVNRSRIRLQSLPVCHRCMLGQNSMAGKILMRSPRLWGRWSSMPCEETYQWWRWGQVSSRAPSRTPFPAGWIQGNRLVSKIVINLMQVFTSIYVFDVHAPAWFHERSMKMKSGWWIPISCTMAKARWAASSRSILRYRCGKKLLAKIF